MHAHPLDARIAHVEGAFDQVNERFSIDEYDGFDRRFEGIDRRFESVDRRFKWLTGIVVATWATTILTILFSPLAPNCRPTEATHYV